MGMESWQGQLLVATPKLGDSNFFRSVVLLIRHGEEGALGLILNRPSPLSFAEVWRKLMESDCPSAEKLLVGGPCAGPLMALHREAVWSDAEVLPEVYFTAAPSNLTQLVEQNVAPIRFFGGHAGWGAGQLEGEVSSGAWFLAPATAEHVFGDTERMWEELVHAHRRRPSSVYEALGIKHVPPDPTWN